MSYSILVSQLVLDVPPAYSLLLNMSAMMLNTMENLDHPMLLPSNYELVGGHHVVATQNETLPKDLQKFADGAKTGLVVITQGDNTREIGMEEFYANLMDIFRARPEYRLSFYFRTFTIISVPVCTDLRNLTYNTCPINLITL